LGLLELDWDVSKHVQQDGILEVGISQVRLMRWDKGAEMPVVFNAWLQDGTRSVC
jgi:hypothetical protein